MWRVTLIALHPANTTTTEIFSNFRHIISAYYLSYDIHSYNSRVSPVGNCLIDFPEMTAILKILATEAAIVTTKKIKPLDKNRSIRIP